MISFKVVETVHRIGPKKGQKAYQWKTNTWRIPILTSLSPRWELRHFMISCMR